MANERPLLCLVDDAQRLDRASADTVVFVARRLESERIALLVAARDDNDDNVREFLAPGLPELHLGGLGHDAAVQLLEARSGKIARDVRDRLIRESGGNPLALLELPAILSGEQLAGRESMPEWLPLGTTLQQAFLGRLRRLPPLTQRLLLVAAAEETGEVATVLAAAQRLAIGPEALEPAEHAGLVQVTESTLRFHHPLVRSAIYQEATFTARRSVHRALSEVLQGEQHADRRAWHLAAATIRPDEQVASTLERSADRARRRGGPGSAAAALERAASLTPQVGPRARRLVAAAEYLWEAGHSKRALSVLDQIPPLPMDVAVCARSAHVRGAIELATGTPAAAYTVLARGAEPILESDPERAREMLALAAWAALAANDLDRVVGELSPAMSRVPGQDDLRIKRVAESLIASGLVHAPPIAASLDGTWNATTWPHPAFTWVWPMLMLVEPVADEVTADQRYRQLAAARRHAGTVSILTAALANLALVEASIGKWPTAVSNATEGLRLARDTGQPAIAGYFLAMLAAIAAEQGRADDCRRLADEALSIALPCRLAVVAAFASWTLALLDLTGGRARAALDRLRALATPRDLTAHAGIALLATGTLVEAAARSGALEGMEPVVARFERWAQLDRRPWTLLVARRSRALISDGDAERHFRAALAVEGIDELPFELARTELLYGEWLRRARRRADARTHLRTALEIFERLGAMSFVERAHGELRASGETARKREPGSREQLTPQELQIARLARQGLRNREIAARLFLSPHTVGYHLHKVYAKLGIVSRAGLQQLDLDNDPALMPQPWVWLGRLALRSSVLICLPGHGRSPPGGLAHGLRTAVQRYSK